MELLANIDVDDITVATDFYCRALNLTVGRRFGMDRARSFMENVSERPVSLDPADRRGQVESDAATESVTSTRRMAA